MYSAETYSAVQNKIDEVKRVMKDCAVWSAEKPPAAAFENMGAFGTNTMSFVNWLQFVLIPRVHETIASKGDFPTTSSVGLQGMREFDGDESLDPLRHLLFEFDDLIEKIHLKE